MLKHIDTSSSFITNETKFALYIEIAKPLILNLPDINDKAKALAWFRKIIFDNSILLVRIKYLELLLKFLLNGKLSGPFAGLPDSRRPLQKLNKGIKIQPVTRCDKINQFIQVSTENNNSSTLRCSYMKVIHQENNREHNMQCLNGNKRISAGYSPFTEREIKHQLKNIINSPGNDDKKINKLKEMLVINCLPPITSSDESELNRQLISNDTFNKVISKENCIHRNNLHYEYPADEKKNQHVHGKHSKTAENSPIHAKLKEENHQNTELDHYCGIRKKSELESFLVDSKKYLTLCVYKDCLVERNILKCIKYIISNAQCKFFKFKEYCSSSQKGFNLKKPRNTCDISKKHNKNSFANKEIRRKKRNSYEPEINETSFFNNNSVFTRLRNVLINNLTFASTCNLFQSMVGNSIYIKMSVILAAGIIFFWKVYQIIFAYQCKRLGYSAQIISKISNIRKDAYSLYVYIFVGCFIFYQILKDFMNIFCKSY